LLLVLLKIALGVSEVLKGRGVSAVMSTLACLAAAQHCLISFPFVRIDPRFCASRRQFVQCPALFWQPATSGAVCVVTVIVLVFFLHFWLPFRQGLLAMHPVPLHTPTLTHITSQQICWCYEPLQLNSHTLYAGSGCKHHLLRRWHQ